MPGRVAKYSRERSAEIALEAFSILADRKTAMTLAEIQSASLVLAGTTTQKISRELSKYVELGMLHKEQKNGRVAYLCRQEVNDGLETKVS